MVSLSYFGYLICFSAPQDSCHCWADYKDSYIEETLHVGSVLIHHAAVVSIVLYFLEEVILVLLLSMTSCLAVMI